MTEKEEIRKILRRLIRKSIKSTHISTTMYLLNESTDELHKLLNTKT